MLWVFVVMCLASHTRGKILPLRCSFHILYMYLHLPYIQLYTLLMHTGFIYACCDVTLIFYICIYIGFVHSYTCLLYTSIVVEVDVVHSRVRAMPHSPVFLVLFLLQEKVVYTAL